MAWYDLLLPASFRGVPFGVRGSEYGGGRRTATHSYPFRDAVWVEDLGKLERRVTFSGFIVGDGCYARAKLLLRACEVKGPGTLVHPSLGILRVALVSPVRMVERAEKGGMVELQFEFAETLDPTYPSAGTDAISRVLSMVDRAIGAVGDSFIGEIVGAAVLGIGIVSAVSATVSAWGNLASSLVRNVGLTSSVKGVTPESGTYDRYSGGNRRAAVSDTSTVQEALDAAVTARTAVDAAVDALVAAAAAGRKEAVVAAAFVVTEAIRAACADPADAVRLLARAAAFDVPVLPSAAPVGAAIATAGAATAAACRRAAICSLAVACTEYDPASYDEAMALQDRVAALIQAEELRLGPAAADGVYQVITQLRAAVVSDLTTRGAVLPRLRTVRTPQSRPSLVLAYHLYADAARADELTRRVNPSHPGFMPAEFRALTD